MPRWLCGFKVRPIRRLDYLPPERGEGDIVPRTELAQQRRDGTGWNPMCHVVEQRGWSDAQGLRHVEVECEANHDVSWVVVGTQS